MNFKKEKKFCFVFVFVLLIFVTPTLGMTEKQAWNPRNIVLDSVDIKSTIILTYNDGSEVSQSLDSRAAKQGIPADINKHNTITMSEKPQNIEIKIVVTNYGMDEVEIKYNLAIFKEDKMLEAHSFTNDLDSLRKITRSYDLSFQDDVRNYEAETYFLLLISFSVTCEDVTKEQTLINYMIETEEEKETFWGWLFE